MLFALVVSALAADPPPKYKEPLKSVYESASNDKYRTSLMDTEERGTGVALKCEVGQALPDPNRDGWFTNKPIPGLQLLAEPAFIVERELPNFSDRTHGWIVFVKNGEMLKQLEPKGDDWFLAWDVEAAEYSFSTGSDFRGPTLDFSLMSGNGFYYSASPNGSGRPEFFLSGCSRSKVVDLPVYDFVFPGLGEVLNDGEETE